MTLCNNSISLINPNYKKMNKPLIKIGQISQIIQINRINQIKQIKHHLSIRIDRWCNLKFHNQCNHKLNNQWMKNTIVVQIAKDNIKLICYLQIIAVIFTVENVQTDILVIFIKCTARTWSVVNKLMLNN